MSRDTQEDLDVDVVTEKPEFEEPRQYEVVLHNDDYTMMDFVIEILQSFFHKTEEEAERIMLTVHEKGSAIAGVYPREIAEMRVKQVTDYSRQYKFPLMVTLQPH